MKYGANSEEIDGKGFVVHPSDDSAISYDDFLRMIRKPENQGFKGYLFRGQKIHTRKLEPSLLRRFKSYFISDEILDEDLVNEKANEYRLFVKEHLEQFKLSLRGRIRTEQSLLEKDNEIWSIGQHYGLATPLLDWTASIAVAQFFCFEKKNANPQEFRSIYFWNAKYWQEVYHCSSGIEHQKEDEEAHLDVKGNRAELIDLGKDIEDRPWEYFNEYGGEDSGTWLPDTDGNIPRVFVPKYGDNGRMVNQRGVFSAWDSVHSMEYLAEKIYENDLSLSDYISETETCSANRLN